jgi:choline kinase
MRSSRSATPALKALIPAAGRGLRAWPKASAVPKVLLEIDGKPVLQRNIEILATAWASETSP